MSYLWHLDGLSMALGIGELDGCTRSWNTKCHSIFFWTRDFFEHEIRRRPTDRREVITRITRIFFLHTELIFFAHGSHSRIFVRGGALTLEHEIFLNTNFTRILFGTRLSFFKHTDLTALTDFEPSARCEWQLVVVIGSLWMTARCGYWLVVVIDSLWLLACCGYWLVMF